MTIHIVLTENSQPVLKRNFQSSYTQSFKSQLIRDMIAECHDKFGRFLEDYCAIELDDSGNIVNKYYI